jgi:hypothetical protein
MSIVQGAVARGAQRAAATSDPMNALAGVTGDRSGPVDGAGGSGLPATMAGVGGSGLPATMAGVVALIAGSSSAVLGVCFVLMSFRRRRREAVR